MSLSQYPFSKKQRAIVVDPRLDFNEEPFYKILAPANQITYRKIAAQSNSANEIIFTNSQSVNFAIARKVYISAIFRFTITGVPAENEFLITLAQDKGIGLCAPRQFPLHAITKAIILDINSETFTYQVNDYIDALMRYGNEMGARGLDLSGGSSFPDYFQQYSDFVTKGYGLNPFSDIGEHDIETVARGGTTCVVTGNAVGNANGDERTATVTFTTYEPVFASPLNYGGPNQKALIGCNNFNLTYQFDTSTERIWSQYFDPALNGNVPGNVKRYVISDFVVVSPPELHMIYFTPRDTLYINPVQRWPYYNMIKQTKTVGLRASGVKTTSWPSDVIQLSGVPNKIFIWARRKNGDRKFYHTDSYGRIDALSLYFNNQDAIFSQCTPHDLYMISRQNGLNVSFPVWNQTMGGVFCANLATDIPMDNTLAVGSSAQIQLQYNLSFTNISAEEIDFTLFTVIIYEGVLTNDRSIMSREQNIISVQDVIDSEQLPVIPYQDMNIADFSGSGLYSDFVKSLKYGAKELVNAADNTVAAYNMIPSHGRQALESGYKVVKSNLPQHFSKTLDAVENLSPKVLNILRKYTADGYTEEQAYQLMMANGGKYMKTGVSRARMTRPKPLDGGKMLTKAELKKLLDK
jgi:hypothetical protein